MTKYTVRQLIALLERGEISSEALTKNYINAIEENNSELCAYITVTAEKALSKACEVDRCRQNGERLGALAGVPFGAKDNLCTKGVRTTCGSKMLADLVPPYTATALKRLDSEDAVMLGKMNMDEFAMGSATDTSAFGITKNPLDKTRTAGGSSGGGAAAVAAGLAPFALGTDTGGSVRQPAAFCGCVGLKPTYGAVSRYGLIAFASSFDTVGVLSRCVDDSKTVFEVIRGRDVMDATTRDASGVAARDTQQMCVGLCRRTAERADPKVEQQILRAAEQLRSAGVRIKEIELPDTELSLAAYYIISAAEASSNLGRYDGVRYGHRADGARSIDELFVKSRSEGFGDEVKRRIMLGTFCLHGAGRDDHYAKAQLARRAVTASLRELLTDCDALLLPTAPSVAYRFDEKKPTPLEVYREDAFCVPANLAGLPAISVPYGSADGMPVGAQLIGRAFDEQTLFALGEILEK